MIEVSSVLRGMTFVCNVVALLLDGPTAIGSILRLSQRGKSIL